MRRTAHLLYIEQHDVFSEPIVFKVRDVSDRVVVTRHGVYQFGIVDTLFEFEIVIL